MGFAPTFIPQSRNQSKTTKPQQTTMKPLLIALSGPSSSGKTTLARLLRDVLSPNLIILHQDDFYRPEAELLVRHGLRDWDCAEAIDLEAFLSTLHFIKEHGKLPPDLNSKEDQNAVGESGVSANDLEFAKSEMSRKWKDYNLDGRLVVVVDGFLLFGKSVPEVREMFDLRILLRTSHDVAKQRREARTGYVTLEGFWEDPPGYVDSIVWPAYIREHSFLFRNNDVEGEVNDQVASAYAISVCPNKGLWSLGEIMQWVLTLTIQALSEHI